MLKLTHFKIYYQIYNYINYWLKIKHILSHPENFPLDKGVMQVRKLKIMENNNQITSDLKGLINILNDGKELRFVKHLVKSKPITTDWKI